MAYLRVTREPGGRRLAAAHRQQPAARHRRHDARALIQHAEAIGLPLRDALRDAASVLPGAAAKRNVEDFDRLLDVLGRGLGRT